MLMQCQYFNGRINVLLITNILPTDVPAFGESITNSVAGNLRGQLKDVDLKMKWKCCTQSLALASISFVVRSGIVVLFEVIPRTD